MLSRESTGHTFLLQRAIIATIEAVEELVLEFVPSSLHSKMILPFALALNDH